MLRVTKDNLVNLRAVNSKDSKAHRKKICLSQRSNRFGGSCAEAIPKTISPVKKVNWELSFKE